MSFALKRRLYEVSPGWLQRCIGLIPPSLVAGRHYRDTMRRGPALDRLTREEMRTYQEERLGRMLTFVCEQVPAYQALRSTVGRLRPFEALKAFPFLEKTRLQEEFERYLPRDLDRIPHWECTTGGTSGNQLSFLLDDASAAIEMAFIHRLWARVGYTPRCRKATFRGSSFPNLREGVYWKPNPIYNELMFSPFHMGTRTLGLYIEELRRFRPEFLHGYPSAIQLLADHALREKVPLDGLRLQAVLLASEGMAPGQREVLEQAFQCRTFSWYGHSERVILGGECEQTEAYHQFPDYGVLEIVDESGHVLEEDGARGELVGTGLLNYSLPLVRYRTEDWAVRRHFACPCGRAFDRFDQVEGRWRQEYVIGRTGAKISPAALNMHGTLLKNVLRYQYFQDAPGVMELRIMVAPTFSGRDADSMARALMEKVGDEIQVKVRVVPDIALTSRGKLRRLIQEIPSDSIGERSPRTLSPTTPA